MATTATTDDPSSSLIGSQLETYQQLIGMGFDATDCINVAQIFGSNAAGAIECLLNGGIASFQQQQLQQQQQQELEQQEREQEHETFHPKQLTMLLNNNNREEDIVQFKVKPISFLFLNGYIRNKKESKCMDIPDDIQTIIIKYFNFYFIKLNYNIHQDPLLEETELKYMDDIHDMDNDNDEENDEQNVKDASFLSPYRSKYLALKANNRLRDISKQLEYSYQYKYFEDQDGKSYYEYFVNLWMKFKYLKSIYIVNNKFIPEEKITMESIEEWEMKTSQDEERWVEIPCDFRDATISDLDRMIANVDKEYVLELGIEKYDQSHQTGKVWPFRNEKLVPASNEAEIIYSALKSGIHQSSNNQNNTNNNNMTENVDGNAQNADIDPKATKVTSVSNEQINELLDTIRQISINDDNQENDVSDEPDQNGNNNDHGSNNHNNNNGNSNEPNNENADDAEQEEENTDNNDDNQNVNNSNVQISQDTTEVNDNDNNNAADTSPADTSPPQQVLRNWKCVNCGHNNDRTHVICGGCFIDKDPSLYNNNNENVNDEKKQEERGIVPLDSELVEWLKYIGIGDIVDCCDTQDKWYECVIRLIEFKDDKMIIYVHYVGWNKKWDEGIVANNIERVAKRNTFTKGPHRPRKPSATSYRSINLNSHYPNFKVTPSQYNTVPFFVPPQPRAAPPPSIRQQHNDDDDDDDDTDDEQDSSKDVNNEENDDDEEEEEEEEEEEDF